MITRLDLSHMIVKAAIHANVRIDIVLALAGLEASYATAEEAEAAVAAVIQDDGPWYVKVPTYVYLWESGGGHCYLSVHDRDNDFLGAYSLSGIVNLDLRSDVEALLDDGADAIRCWSEDNGTDYLVAEADLRRAAEVVATFTATGRTTFDFEAEYRLGRFAGGGEARHILKRAGYNLD